MCWTVLLLQVLCVTMTTRIVLGVGTCSDQFKCEYHVLEKLIKLEDQVSGQTVQISALQLELREAKSTIANLNQAIQQSNEGTTYVRWGRTVCAGDVQLVYAGFAAGKDHQHTGTASNTLCLPTNPDYDKYTDGFQSSGRIFGAEYETGSYGHYKDIHDHDVPCAVCRIPRTNVLMVPGKNTCHENYILEYKGYLTSEFYLHKSAGEFLCVDDQPEILDGGASNKNGRLFYFVEAECGSLKCPPYVNGRELTCAVCSFSPFVNTHSQTTA